MDCCYEPNSDVIPIDLFVSKNKSGGGGIKFTDSSSNLVFSVDPRFPDRRLLHDSSGNPQVSIARIQKAIWECFSKEKGDLMCRVERTTHSLTRLEFKVFLNNGNLDDPNMFDFEMRGSPFYRSCTIYKGDSIVAQTSLMYKLGIKKVIVPRNRFRLTIFPGYEDHAFIVALTVIFFYSRKLWI